jgi:hypothetical protein
MSGPNVWGPYGWKFIHYITLGYPSKPTEDDKKIYYDFFILLAKVLPCSICGHHFSENMKVTPLSSEVLSSRQKLVEWGIEMHNHVNRIHNKKTYTFEEGIKEILKDPLGDCIRKMKNEIVELETKPTIKLENFENKEKEENTDNNIHYKYYSVILNFVLIVIIIYLLYKKNKN